MKHIMVDLETLGCEFDAAILSIGAVVFDPYTGEQFKEFYEAVDLESALEYGNVSASTIKWWMNQCKEAQVDAFTGTKGLIEVINRFAWFYREANLGQTITPIWGNGSSFDITILEHAYSKASMKTPWPYNAPRDCRTIKDLCSGYVNIPEFVGTQHNALDDAKFQAKWVSDMYKRLREGLEAAEYYDYIKDQTDEHGRLVYR